MRELDLVHIRSAMSRLFVEKPRVFGAERHRFVLNDPLPEVDLSAFEDSHGISLPKDYRHFISKIGNGGAGPYYGVFPLGFMAGLGTQLKPWREKDGFVGVLSEPFPLRAMWNDTSSAPPDDLIDRHPEEYDQQEEAFEKAYWDAARVNGALPICHLGCALRLWLVVTGYEAGHLWRDGRADGTGLSPMSATGGSRATFSFWYLEWLDECLKALR